ncbi:hypothetical protein E4U21_005290 [Claviceps maximensis]|nr:hypothetical protein E4U21_005290 [Claviceps maximensis]
MYGTMEHGDLGQLSHRSEPWVTIRNHDFISKIDLIMPLNAFLAMPSEVIRHRQGPAHYRLTGSSLGQLLRNKELFGLLQKGEATLFSQHHDSAVHTQFSLNKGTLMIQTDKPTFEALGLSGNTGLVKGQHVWTVSLDLEKAKRYCDGEAHKQQEQSICAFKSITTEHLTWLLCAKSGSRLVMDLGHDVDVIECTAEMQLYECTTSPPPMLDIGHSVWKDNSHRETQEIGLHVYEWLSLLRLESPRLQYGDSIDTFLSRYKVADGEHGERQQTAVCKISWIGLIGATWFQTLVRDVLAVQPAGGWLSVSSNSFRDVSLSGNMSELVILRPSIKDDQYVMWTLNNCV